MHTLSLFQENTVDIEGKLILCDYLNYPRPSYDESLEHMLGSAGIQTNAWGFRCKVFPQRARGCDNKITTLGKFHQTVLNMWAENVSTH